MNRETEREKCGLCAHTINHNEFDWKEIIVCYGEYIVWNTNHSTAIVGYEIDTIDQTKSNLQQPQPSSFFANCIMPFSCFIHNYFITSLLSMDLWKAQSCRTRVNVSDRNWWQNGDKAYENWNLDHSDDTLAYITFKLVLNRIFKRMRTDSVFSNLISQFSWHFMLF